MTATPWNIIVKPVVTEKSTRLAKERTYEFIVRITANKPEIRYAVEKAFGVKVQEVRTIRMKGKRKRMRNFLQFGKRKDWKKAYVTLKEGSRLDII